ncbi:MAG: ATP-binding protein [Chloroflexi bacterium]|nr:ATP-binding protein [Chloroflexota bacterium]
MIWLPSSLEELDRVLSERILGEAHTVDFKRELPTGAAANKALAVDLASMAVDGGLIVIGVDEELHPPRLALQALAGVKERVDQIAASRVDQPVSVRTIELPATDPTLGVLLIVIPPSPDAPHMVDGRYRGRGDTTNLVLTDIEVRRIRDQRALRVADLGQQLDAEIAQPRPANLLPGARLHVLARPTTGHEEMLLDATEDGRAWFSRAVVAGRPVAALSEPWSPDFGGGLSMGRRADGWSLTRVDSVEQGDRILELVVTEEGEARLFSNGITRRHDNLLVNDVAVAGLTKRVVLTAQVVVAATRYLGLWDFGVAVTELRGATAMSLDGQLGLRSLPQYSDERYRRVIQVSGEDLERAPDEIVHRLLDRLGRGLTGQPLRVPSGP